MEFKDPIDRWLEKGLAEYGSAEPRAGLEGRILANLKAEREHVASRRLWWAFSAVFAVMIVLAFVWPEARPKLPPAPVREDKVASIQAAEPSVKTPLQRSTLPRSANPVNHAAAVAIHTHSSRRRLANRVRLEQFPSAQALSREVESLLEYVRATPRNELLTVVARATDTSDLQVRDLEIPPLKSDETK